MTSRTTKIMSTVLVGVLILAAAVVAILGLSVKNLIDDGFGSVSTCHSIEADFADTRTLLEKGRILEGRQYKCGQIVGSFPTALNEIHYVFRGKEKSDRSTTFTLEKSITKQLTENGWKAGATNVSDRQYRDMNFLRSAASNRPISLRVKVISPKWNLFVATVYTGSDYNKNSRDTTTLVDTIPSPYLHRTYASFVLRQPKYAPKDYLLDASDGSAWRADFSAEIDGYDTYKINVVTLRSSVEKKPDYVLRQSVYEPDDTDARKDLKALKRVAVSKQGYDIYAKKDATEYMVKLNDSLITFEVRGFVQDTGRLLSQTEIRHVVDSLEPIEPRR